MTEGERPFIGAAVKSVLSQSHPTTPTVYVAETNTWIEQEVGNADGRVIVRRIPMQSLSHVRNLGVSEAQSDWVAFLDGDDLWVDDKVELQLEATRRRQRDAIGTRHLMIRADGKPYAYGLARKMPMPSSWIARRELLLANPFDIVPMFEDAFLWNRLKQAGRTHTMREFLLHYRVREQSLSSGFPAKDRKMRIARMSRRPLMRLPLLLATRVWSMMTPCR